MKLEEIVTPPGVKLSSTRQFADQGLKMDVFSDLRINRVAQFLVNFDLPICRAALQNNMHEHLKKQNFDLVIIDLYSNCLKIVVDYIDTHVVQYSNWGFTSDTRIFYPFLPSLSCGAELEVICTTGRPSFARRLKNVISSFTYNRLLPQVIIVTTSH